MAVWRGRIVTNSKRIIINCNTNNAFGGRECQCQFQKKSMHEGVKVIQDMN
jgi:GTP cyclohydrolase II